jgi:hypothetical protein
MCGYAVGAGFGFNGCLFASFWLDIQNNLTLNLSHMLTRSMQKKKPTPFELFNSVFTTRTLIIIIGLLSGVLCARLLGFA